MRPPKAGGSCNPIENARIASFATASRTDSLTDVLRSVSIRAEPASAIFMRNLAQTIQVLSWSEDFEANGFVKNRGSCQSY